ncbi:hypothetical protein [Amycolatopsis sp. NBC_00438]|uniref:hypothetical protein n=1 Tax=Amycolatopsis sp. NBC_00438 TaxID=2903558 RepID=UPI002E1F4FF5
MPARPLDPPATYTAAQVDTAVSVYLALSSAVGGLGVLAWLTTTWAVRAGKRWARPATTVLLVLGVAIGLTGLLVKDTSGDTGLPSALGWSGVAPCLAALLAVALLWRRPETRYR